MGLDAQHRQLVRALSAAALLLAAAAAPAQAQPCRLALAFALDVSASVDAGEYRLQLDGLGAALTDPAVRSAMLAAGSAVALGAYEWSGARQQAIIAPWTVVGAAAELDAFAGRVIGHVRRYGEFPTAVGYALGYGATLMRKAPPCARRVIDISGDGVNNDGFSPAAAYRAFDFAGITVNGLVVGGDNLELISFYQFEVAHGPEAFVEVAADYADFACALRRKLLRELAGDHVAGSRPLAGKPAVALARSRAWNPRAAPHP